MKQLSFLVVGVLIILGAWWAVGKFSSAVQGPVPLVLPADPADKAALLRAANQLWRADAGYYEPAAVIGLLNRVVDQLEDGPWRAACPAALYAWERHRDLLELRSTFATLNPRILPRFAAQGGLFELAALVRLANLKAFDAAAINAALGALASAPIPDAGFDGSRLEDLVLASIMTRDLTRAKGYLTKAVWATPPSAEQKVPMEFLIRSIELPLAATESGRLDLPAAVRLWKESESRNSGPTIVRPLLEEQGIRALETLDPGLPGPKPQELLIATAEEPGAEPYWARVVARFLGQCTQGNEMKNNNLASLLTAYEERFKKPGTACQVWMKAADETFRAVPEDPLRWVRLYERALAVATLDPDRAQAARRIATGYLKASTFAKAREVLERVLGKLSDATLKKELEALLVETKKREASDEARVALQVKAIDQDRRRGRLSNMKDRLESAKKNGRPAEEITAIESAIKDLEREVLE